MRIIQIRAHAKINLYLNVLGKRPDGYHNIESIIQSIALADELTLVPDGEGQIILEGAPFIPDEENLVFKAAALLKKETGATSKGVKISLYKRIPLAAGLGGGSADAAATLAGLNTLWNLNLSLADLNKLAARLGSDIPFCLRGGTMLAQGKGESLVSLQALPILPLVIAKPSLDLRTAEVYRAFDEQDSKKDLPEVDIMRKALEKSDLQGIGQALTNVFEEIVFPQYPEIKDLKERALEAGALGALLCGSGSSIFALAETEDKAKAIVRALEKICPRVILSSSFQSGLEIKRLAV